jgi:hypothetical protein
MAAISWLISMTSARFRSNSILITCLNQVSNFEG